MSLHSSGALRTASDGVPVPPSRSAWRSQGARAQPEKPGLNIQSPHRKAPPVHRAGQHQSATLDRPLRRRTRNETRRPCALEDNKTEGRLLSGGALCPNGYPEQGRSRGAVSGTEMHNVARKTPVLRGHDVTIPTSCRPHSVQCIAIVPRSYPPPPPPPLVQATVNTNAECWYYKGLADAPQLA